MKLSATYLVLLCGASFLLARAQPHFDNVPINIGPLMAENGVRSMLLADVNGDGDPDLLTGGRARYGSTEGCLMLALHDDTSENYFQTPVTLSSNPQESYGKVRAIATGDLDEDGNTDVVVALERGFGDFNDQAAILAYFNDGIGGFTAASILSDDSLTVNTVTLAKPSSWDVKLADMNNDGHIDIVAAIFDEAKSDFNGDNNGSGILFYFQNDGNANFNRLVLSDELVGLAKIVLGDFDVSGTQDIALISEKQTQFVVYYNDPPIFNNDPPIFNAVLVDNSAQSTRDITVGDVDMDEKLDIVCQGVGTVTLYRNLGGRGNFQKKVLVDTENYVTDSTLGNPRKVLIHDIDGDGLNDIVHLRTPFYEIHWNRQVSPLVFESYSKLNDLGLQAFEISDVTKDGIGDLVIAKSYTYGDDSNVYAFAGLIGIVEGNGCDPNPCEHGGICTTVGLNSFSCDCTDTGYTGDTCETEITDCEPNPCEHGGICTDGLDSFTCDCTDTGYAGDTCETEINDCEPNPCEHGGICTTVGLNSFSCDCTDTGYAGDTCENEILDSDGLVDCFFLDLICMVMNLCCLWWNIFCR